MARVATTSCPCGALAARGVPKMLFCDNGSEFSSQIMDLWAYQNGVRIDFSRPTMLTSKHSMGRFEPNAWTRIGSVRSQRRRRESKLGRRNIMRVVLTGLSERGRRTNSLVRSGLAPT
jgi:hypothetical protein